MRAVTFVVSRLNLTYAGSVRVIGGAICGALSGFRSAGSGLISGLEAPAIPGMLAIAWGTPLPVGIGADAIATRGSTTVRVPFIPASLWPGMEQMNSKAPGLSNVKSAVADWPA